MTYKFLIALLFFIDSISAAIIETSSFSDLLKEVDQESLVFIDMDETMVTGSRTLGSQQWWTHMKATWNRAEPSGEESTADFNRLVNLIIDHVPEVCVEESIPTIIQTLQNQGITVWSLTARMKNSPWDSQHDLTTARLLSKLGIDLTRSSIPPAVSHERLAAFPHFSLGVLYTNWSSKGPYLRNFLNTLDYRPTKIVMIDDSMDQLKSVELIAEELAIEFIGFHYPVVKERGIEFDPALGNIELEALHQKGLLLSDEEARRIKEENPDRAPDYYLEQLLLHYKEKSGMLIPH